MKSNYQKLEEKILQQPSVVIWDGTSYYVEDTNYEIDPEEEEIVFRGTFCDCRKKCDELNYN